MKRYAPFAGLLLIAASSAALHCVAAASSAERQAEVAQKGRAVMPFDLKATQHVFVKNKNGGEQQVVVRNAADKKQVELIREHLLEMRREFSKGNFDGPSHVHGEQMPGLSRLKQAKPGDLAIEYKARKNGASLTYSASDPTLVKAIHEWFDAQLSDHGADASSGHHHHHMTHQH